MASFKKCLRLLWSLRDLIILIGTPIVLCPLLVNGRSEAACAYVMLLVSVYWIAEVLPLTITALLPLFLFPIVGVMSAADTADAYTGDSIYFVFGSISISVTMEKWNLHKRIAYLTLLLMGLTPGRILLAFMLVSFFLSMWMLNTATAIIMMPIAIAVAEQLNMENTDNGNANKSKKDSYVIENPDVKTEDETVQSEKFVSINDGVEILIQDEKTDRICKSFLLGIAYCSLMGGSATLVGTNQVLYMKEYVDETYGINILSFTSWMAVAVPCQLISICIGWLWLQWLFLDLSILRCSTKCCSDKDTIKQTRMNSFIRKELEALGPVRWAEGSVIVLFVLAIVVWFTADPVIFPGWISLDKEGYISITTASICIPIFIFIWPADPFEAYREFKKDVRKKFEWETLMDIKTMHTKYPWMVVFLLLGCVFALGRSAKVSGLSSWLADQLIDLESLDPWLIVLIFTSVIALLCECLGNASVVIIALPILSELAHDMEVNPMYFIAPAVLAASFAFMLPVASGPNIIAYSYNKLYVKDMAKAGLLMNIICIFIVNVSTHTLCVWVFDIYTYPEWAPKKIMNTTIPIVTNTTVP